MPNKNLKSYKYEVDGKIFSSKGEVEMYEVLKRMNVNFQAHPNKINIIKPFQAASGKKYVAMNYEPDFVIDSGKGYKIYIEVKGQNDMVYIFKKGEKPTVMNKADLYRMKHRIIDKKITEEGNIFMVVRHSPLKTPAYTGLFFDKDFEQFKKFKTQKRLDLCEIVPRIEERLKDYINV